MPAQEVKWIDDPSHLMRCGERGALLDGGSVDSWGDGSWLYCSHPVATLEVFASGWTRWSDAAGTRWIRDDPFRQWTDFHDRAARSLPVGADLAAARIVSAFGYDLKHWIERLPRRLPWCDEPILYAALYDGHLRGEYRTRRCTAAACDEAALSRLAALVERSDRADSASPKFEPTDLVAALPDHEHIGRTRRILEYIAAGDVYQVNLAREFRADLRLPAAPALVRAQRASYPMPYAAGVDLGDLFLVSNSPECFLRIGGREASTFPIKGTRRSDADPRASSSSTLDTRHSTLSSDPKERAEHVMIVDLERNDLGRICETGSVEVCGLATPFSFPLLTHMISEVRGRLRTEVGLADVLRATFPGGSITGAPKVRAMQIIEELEPAPRGFYTGAIGWSDLAGNACFNIAIRTAVVGRGGLSYHAGGGIVADSDPRRELEETVVKSEALRRVLAQGGRR